MKSLLDAIFSPFPHYDPVSVLLRRKFRGGGGGGELPDGFTRIPGIKLSSARFVIPDFFLTGDDTLRFSARGKSGNWIGCFNFTAAENNYSFYAGTNATSKYARYNGQQGGSAIYVDTWYDVEMSPNGVTGIRNPSEFTPSSFISEEPLCIGATSRDGSVCSAVDFRGDIVVSRRLKLIPVERDFDGVIGLHDGTTFYEPIEGTVTRLEDEAMSFGLMMQRGGDAPDEPDESEENPDAPEDDAADENEVTE